MRMIFMSFRIPKIGEFLRFFYINFIPIFEFKNLNFELKYTRGVVLEFIENCLKLNIQPVFIKTDDFCLKCIILHENTAGYSYSMRQKI